MNSSFGSTGWAEAGRGALTGWERRMETLRGARAVLLAQGQRLARRVGLQPRAFSLALAEVPLPRSRLSVAAQARLEATPAWNVAHSLRSYYFGSLLARRDGLVFDPEVLFVACALHDLGLVEDGPEACFAWRGAERARQLCTAAGATSSTAAEVAEAICKHINVVP